MTIHPSLVVGVGTSGALVTSNIERILYEVLGDTPLELLKLLVVETDNTPRETEVAPGGRISQMVDAFEPDIGKAIRDLNAFLKTDFDWCPKDLVLGAGRGAGNVRAGGRLMFHSRFPDIYKALQRSMNEAAEQVTQNTTTHSIQKLFKSRGLEMPVGTLDPSRSVVYTVGTLAGGTCSGMCVDMGYAIRQIDPQAERIGIFFVPDPNSPDTFRQNAWAALKDLEYFIDNQGAFQGVWKSEQRTPMPYSRGAAKPYDRIYLISSLNQSAQTRLQYQSNMQSPLIVMVATMIAADLLGLYSLRAGKLVNLNQHVTGPEKHRTFLNFSLRGISYPKYEISEAASCKVVADTMCGNWLSKTQYVTKAGMGSNILEDNERAKGRDVWNEKFNVVWSGAGPSVDLEETVKQVREQSHDDPGKVLKHLFSSNAQNTLYSKVAQTMPSRLDEIKAFVEAGLRECADHTLNFRCMELFLEGVLGELELTKRYWEAIGTPARTNATAWTALTNASVDHLLSDHKSLLVMLVGAKEPVIHDGLAELRTRLSMHLMMSVLEEAADWIKSDRLDWVTRMSRMMQEVQSIASERCGQIVRRLREDRSGPVLKISRSRSESFDVEVDRLAQGQKAAMQLPFLDIFKTATGNDSNRAGRIFLRLKNEVQPGLLDQLVKKGYVNIAEQLRDQNQIEQATIYLRHALDMSLASHPTLQKSHTAVPSYVVAKDDFTSQNLMDTITQVHIPGLQDMETKSLPMFDHMAIFYQEGADFEPAYLDSADAYRKTYEERMKTRPDYLDPLGYMKTTTASTPEAH